ncbi:MAG TPA: sigma-70 family RNA polymerase sigma factor [Vicinamibacterales bacterium]|nr:sigma-70 family RNA polymerase sigma factor [Vicinamibacterales bacterium]
MNETRDTPVLVDRLFRTQAGRLVAHFARRFGPANLDLAEEVVQDALVAALQHWPYRGVPHNPAGWLYRVACHRAFDILRRRAAFDAQAGRIARELARDRVSGAANEAAESAALADDELRMVLVCCHPALSREARVALSLKTVGGLGVHEIARALLSDSRAVAQRLVRAKRQIRTLGLPFELPASPALGERVESALDVIYLMFNEGYGAHDGENLVRADLCREAIRLGRLITGAPEIADRRADALVALMALHAARLPARVDAAGELVLLEDQDRSLWDRSLLALGFECLDRSIGGDELSTYHLQAAIAAAHAQAADPAGTDWPTILGLYDELLELNASPVVALNRAIALARVRGPAAGLAALAPLARRRELSGYYLLPAVRADLLVRLGRQPAARRAYQEALRCRASAPERRFLESRLARLTSHRRSA